MSSTPTLASVFTSIGWGRLVVDPLDDLEPVLRRDDGDTRDTGDEVLQWDSVLQLAFLTYREWAEICCVAFWETGPEIGTLKCTNLKN